MDAAWQNASTSILTLSIGGAAAVLGLWVGRDKDRPIGFAIAMTALIGAAIAIGIAQSVLDAQEAIDKEADLNRMLESVTEIAIATGDTELAALIEAQTGVKIELLPEEPEAAEPAGAEEAPSDASAPADPGAPPDANAPAAATAEAATPAEAAEAPAAAAPTTTAPSAKE